MGCRSAQHSQLIRHFSVLTSTYNNILRREEGRREPLLGLFQPKLWSELKWRVSSIAGHGWGLRREIVSFLPERTKECLLCVGFASNTFWHIEMGWSRQEESPTVTGFLGMSKLFFSVLLSFGITTLHLTGTVKYNESGWGGRGAAETKKPSSFSRNWNIYTTSTSTLLCFTFYVLSQCSKWV